MNFTREQVLALPQRRALALDGLLSQEDEGRVEVFDVACVCLLGQNPVSQVHYRFCAPRLDLAGNVDVLEQAELFPVIELAHYSDFALGTNHIIEINPSTRVVTKVDIHTYRTPIEVHKRGLGRVDVVVLGRGYKHPWIRDGRYTEGQVLDFYDEQRASHTKICLERREGGDQLTGQQFARVDQGEHVHPCWRLLEDSRAVHRIYAEAVVLFNRVVEDLGLTHKTVDFYARDYRHARD